MNVTHNLPLECAKIFERLFVFVDTKDAALNVRLQLVVNPQIIKILLKQVETEPLDTKINLIREISRLFAENSFNSQILAKRDRQIMEFNHSILESVISLVLSIALESGNHRHAKQNNSEEKQVVPRQKIIMKELSDLMTPFFTNYPANPKIIKSILSAVARDFYSERVSHTLLEVSIQVLQNIIRQQSWSESVPNSYFLLYGEETGIKMLSKNVKWPFSKGFHLYIKFMVQDFQNQNMNLFVIGVENDDFILFVTPQGELKVKVFSITEPLTIVSLEKGLWFTLSLSYTLKSKLLRNYYELLCTIDGEIHERRDLPVPNISMGDEIVELTVGHSFYGKLHTVILSRTELSLWNKLVMNSWSDVETLLIVNKKQLRDLFLLYHPLLMTNQNQKEMAYDISSMNHGELYESSGVQVNPFLSVDVNYYGGLYTYLPFLHLLKFYQRSQYPQALAHILQLFLIFFEKRFTNVEVQALHCQFFSIASQLINEISPQFLTRECVVIIKQINATISHILLRKELFLFFLWRINIRRIEDTQVIEGVLEIIQEYYVKSFEWSYGVVPVDAVFHYMIDHFQTENCNECCLYHYSQCLHPEESVNPSKFKNNYLLKTTTLKRILKLLFANLVNYESLLPLNTKIMQILFQHYSPCLKLLLLQSLNEGVKAKASFYVRECNLLNYMYLYLQDARLPEEIAIVAEILLNCQQQDEDNKLLQNNIIHRLANTLDRLYTKKCEEGRSRCRSDRLQGVQEVRLITERRNYSEIKSNYAERCPHSKPAHIPKIGKSIQTNKHLYEAMMKLCFFYDAGQEEYLLKHDDYISVLQPYFKLCCLQFRKNIINMVRNTVILASAGKSIMVNLTSFDKLYKLLLTEFVLKQLEPNEPDYFPTETTNYIIRNVYFIVDYMVMGMRNDWIHLYIYLLRLIALLQEATKEIKQKTDRTVQDISFAMRLSMRKFVLRVVKLAEKNVHNLPNLVFLVYLTVFSNTNDSESGNIFRYFHSLQKYLFEGRYHLLSSEAIDPKEQPSFIDSKLILETVNSFKICNIDMAGTPIIKITNFIQGYLDLEYTNEDTEMYKSRLIYLITAEFKPIRGTDHSSLKDFISGFLGKNNVQDVSIGQIISIMLCLCIQSAINTQNQTLLKQSTKLLQSFFLSFLLLCSRDGLKRECHGQRNSELPRVISYNIMHFLFEMLTNECQGIYLSIIEDTLYNIFCFMGLLITCLYDKLGHPQNFEKGMELARILKHVEQYNFFSFQLMLPVLPLKDMIQIPNADRKKVIRLIYHEKVLERFRKKCALSIQKKIEQATNIHKHNVVTIKHQIQAYFATYNNFNIQSVLANYLINDAQFQKTFVLEYLRDNNLEYRRTQRIWRKIWKRLRLYHYFWAVSMNQRQTFDLPFQKNSLPAYRHKFSKFVDENGGRPILEVEPVEPWHVKKVLMEKQFEYRSSNYLYHLHQQIEQKKKQRSLLQKLMNIKSSDNAVIFYVDWIKNNSKRKGYLSIENQKLKFKYLSTFQKDSHLEFTFFVLAEHRPIEKYWPLIEITDIIERRYLTKKQCLLIEFQDTTSLIFNFINDDKNDFLRLIDSKQAEKSQKLALMRLNHIDFYTKRFVYLNVQLSIDDVTLQWKQHRMSNFKYLMLINKYAGRSYLDPANYPVFPWIIASYDFKQYLNRDLTKTMGALGSEHRIGFFKSKMLAYDPFDPVTPYQFGTHYSSPGVVFNFLIRLHPYTEASRTLQGGKFDLSDRLFNSIKVCWHSVTSEVSDVRELIPEFFYLPQFLLNIQQYNFGLTQQKERVHNVILPIWSSNAYDYIVTNRRELQSEYVSEHLNHWIDLIFGYKQKGKLAEQNLNLFYYLTYENSIDLADIEDQQTKISKEAQIMHFGQTPSQIFGRPHITRNKLPKRRCFGYKKVSILLCLESDRMVSLLRQQGNRLVFFHDYSLLVYQEHHTYALEYEVRLLRNNSRDNLYYTEQVDFNQRVHLFASQKFILIASYVNGDLIIYSLPDGRKIEEKKGTPKNCVFVNQRENLLFCGCKNGLLEIYEIVYGQKDTLTLIKIASEFYMAPVTSITEGGNFYAVTSGNMVVLIKISRSLAYVYDKTKMKGIKMIRSIESSKKIQGCLLCCEPLFCVVFYNALELHSYSVNGQLLKVRQIQMVLPPQKLKDDNFNEYVAVIEDKKLVIYSTPFLEAVRVISLPNKIFREMKFMDSKCYLITNFGEVICLTESQLQQDQE